MDKHSPERDPQLVKAAAAGLLLGVSLGLPYLYLELVRRGWTRYKDFWAIPLILGLLVAVSALLQYVMVRSFGEQQ
jgi:hypothetical protein